MAAPAEYQASALLLWTLRLELDEAFKHVAWRSLFAIEGMGRSRAHANAEAIPLPSRDRRMILKTSKVHIKIADRGWILEKCASEIARRSRSVTFSTDDDASASLQYYVNYSCWRQRVANSEAAFFTHAEEDEAARRKFFSVAREVDVSVCMSKRYAEELRKSGASDVAIISPGVDLNLFRPTLRIGVVGRTYHTGRKGENLVARVMDVPGIEWRFTGSGWPGATQYVSDGNLPAFYNDLDYVLIPSHYEGGPMSALESLACGVPVISSDVGWMDSYPHIPFENGSASSLRQVLLDLLASRDELRESVKDVTWERWAHEHLELFDRIASNKGRAIRSASSSPVESAPATSILIVSHGSEKIARGGPTTRIANIVRTAGEVGVDIEVASSVDNHDVKVAHIFNSWPLGSAVAELRKAKEAGVRAIYSPIALNLQHHDYYARAVPELLRRCADNRQLDEGVKAVHRLTAPFSLDSASPPAEGVKGHFAALKESVELADHVIFLSEYERDFLASIDAKPKDASIVRNGVDARVMAEGKVSDFQNTYGLSDFVLMVGRIESRKNQALVAYALRNLDRPVVCVGHVGDPEYFEATKRWAGRNFVHIERIEDRQVLAGMYKSAGCLVLASWAEGAPLAAIEAAAAGVPLVLSSMSGEREYFGDSAHYVHPCDLEGIRSAVDRALEQGRDVGERVLRGKDFAERYDIRRHAEETIEVYDKALKAPARAASEAERRPRVALDNTHLAHHLSRTKTLTGVPNVEYNVSREIVERDPTIPTLIWTGAARAHASLPFKDLVSATNPLASLDEARVVQKSNFVRLAGVDVHVPLKLRRLTMRRAALSAVKQGIGVLPAPIGRRVISTIRKIRPNFEPHVAPEHRLFWLGDKSKMTITPRFQNLSPLDDRSVGYGDRLILLGQPWISNDAMLDDLCSVVRERGLRLWAHVPDIVYVTDSDAFDDRTRQAYRRRLEKLLSITDTAIVISDQAESDLRQFASSHAPHIKTRRIHLGISHELTAEEPVRPAARFPDRFVMYVSSINNRKRHSFLLDVWKDVRRSLGAANQDVALVLVGSPQAGYAKYRDHAFLEELRRENILLLEGLPGREVAWLYQHCLFTTYPARTEGWGLPPIESLFFGKPCVVTNSIPCAIETKNGALIKLEANDYFSWVNMITSLIANSAMRGELSNIAATFRAPQWADAASALLADE